MSNVIDEIWEDAREEGKLTTLYDLVHDGLLSIKDAAIRADMTEKDFISEMHSAGY